MRNLGGANGVRSSVLAQTVGGSAQTMAVDSDAPGGQVEETEIPHGTVGQLAGFGVTTVATWGSGDYSLSRFFNSSGASGAGAIGDVALGVNIGNADCTYAVTAFG